MAFDLWIEIGGLCAFVREGDHKMHVVMPETRSGHGGHGKNTRDEHAMRLLYDVEHEHEARTEKAEALVHLPLDGAVLDLSGLQSAGTGPIPDLSGVVNLGRVAAKGVPRSLVEGTVSGPLGARLTIGAGRPCAYCRGALWKFADEIERWAISVHWLIPRVQGEQLHLEFTGRGAPKSRTLHPIADEIHLTAVNALPDELPPLLPPRRKLNKGDEVPHFGKFWSLITPAPGARPPTFEGGDGISPDPDPECLAPGSDLSISAIQVLYRTGTCIVAEAPLEE